MEDPKEALEEEKESVPAKKARTRTLLHYFGMVESKTSPAGRRDEAKAAELDANKRRRRDSSGNREVENNGVENGSFSAVVAEERSPAKKKAREEEEEEGQEESERCGPEKTEGDASNGSLLFNGKAITGFFKKVGETEYWGRMRDGLERRVFQVKADVHTPTPTPTPSPECRVGDRPKIRPSPLPPPSRLFCAGEDADHIQVEEEVIIVEAEGQESGQKTEEGEDSEERRAKDGVDETAEERSAAKVSSKLFRPRGKRKKPQEEAEAKQVGETVSADVDSPKEVRPPESPMTKGQEDDRLVDEEEESPELFKHRPRRPRGRRRKAPAVNYDSDSIDLDVLSKIVDRTDRSSGDAGNSFTALIKKPLAPAYAGDEEATEQYPKKASEVLEEISTNVKESSQNVEETSQTEPPAEGKKNNAFAVLMQSVAATKKIAEPEVAREHVEVRTEEALEKTPPPPAARKRGRPKGKKAAKEDKQKQQQQRQEEQQHHQQQQLADNNDDGRKTRGEDSPARGDRRMSSRLQKKRSIEAQLKKETEELVQTSKATEETRESTLKAKKKRTAKSKRRAATSEEEKEKAEDETEEEFAIEKVVIVSPSKKFLSKMPKGKIASIFLTKKQKEAAARAVLPAEDPEKVAARQAFLMSAMPDELKAQMATTASEVSKQQPLPQFSDIGHVSQLGDCVITGRPDPSRLQLNADGASWESPVVLEDGVKVGQLSGLTGDDFGAACEPSLEEDCTPLRSRMSPLQIYHFVQSLKMAGGEFPVKKMFRRFVERKVESDTIEEEAFKKNIDLNELEETRFLRGGRRRHRSKRGERRKGKEGQIKKVKFDPSLTSSIQWTMKYAPECAEDIIGNVGVVKELKEWMESWVNRQRSKKKAHHTTSSRGEKMSNQSGGDSFIATSSSDEDLDSSFATTSSEDDDDDDRLSDNTVLLTGPSGVGKTASVYALAAQLGFKVLEVNASSARGGRQVMAQLQEATQSHHLGKHKGSSVATMLAGKSNQKKGDRKKRTSNSRRGGEDGAPSISLNRTALILFEDVDLAFGDQDEGFYSAVSGLIGTTKRPIVLTTSDQHFSARRLLRGMEPRVFRFGPASPASAARYLQLLCLVEGCPLDSRAVECVLARNAGNVSKSILDLQYWALSSPPVEEVSDTEEDEEEPLVRHKKAAGKVPLTDEDDAVTGDAEGKVDRLGTLMSLSKKSLELSPARPVRPFQRCMVTFLGSQQDCWGFGSTLFLRRLFDDCPLDRSLFESNILSLLPFHRRALPEVSRKRFVPSDGECRKVKRVAACSDFLEPSSDEEAGEGAPPVGQAQEDSQRRPTREELRNAEFGLAEMVKCAEARSRFCLASQEDDSLMNDLSFEAQIRTLDRCSKAVRNLVAKGQVGDELTVSTDVETVSSSDEITASSSLLAAYRALRDSPGGGGGGEKGLEWKALEAALETPTTLAPTPHLTETLPTLRSMARAEEVRRASGEDKKSRSGRFLHYLEMQEIYLEPACLQALCDAFL